MAQSLFQHGQIETTLIKAKEIRPFVERLITLARRGTLQSRQRIISLLNDRSVIGKDEQEKYDAMSAAQRRKVLVNRSGRRHRAGKVPASYNKKTISFVAKSVIHMLITEIAPKYAGRPGGYTRIIRLPKRRIGDNSDLALLQLVGHDEEPPKAGGKKVVGRRRQKAADRVRILEGKSPQRRTRGSQSKAAAPGSRAGETRTAGGEAGETAGQETT